MFMRYRFPVLVSCAAMLGALAIPAAAQDAADAPSPETMTDLKCASILLVAISGPDVEEGAKAGISTLIGYYVGRAEARSPDFEVAALMPAAAEEAFASETAFDAVQAECEARSDGFGRLMDAIGTAMDASVEEAGAEPAEATDR